MNEQKKIFLDLTKENIQKAMVEKSNINKMNKKNKKKG